MLRSLLEVMNGWPSTVVVALVTGVVATFATLAVAMNVSPETNYEAGLPLLLAAFWVGGIVGAVLWRRRLLRRQRPETRRSWP
jgi:hypothetical protein